ncbi:STAS/SEC14 domain-containing protein [Flammeovirga yaeyamensis]|uniref:STAS/SEC14 domain-containing protein n=1 Tax=Flammeovirga yaeyamensis TaxID=367791 RepID=A0AAX1N1J4_9BACT|nr:STAS/SEC14 domain-containing protein [Flammeovirga yaeyamensis]MBB3698292.1 hypothetical protein [Flammeovirga yaeyamensis]NMF34355.1 STAS/SEC14 domain-containing protein [Flammeovirga yaeyamensis]QWG01336.1 STAS/SEC14 domain-containing protein [Flammeovirga yaeyamensis]
MININNTLGSQIIGFTLSQKIDLAEIDQLTAAIEAKAQNGPVRLLGEIENIQGFEHYKKFYQLMKEKYIISKKIERYAIVDDYSWLKHLSGFADFMVSSIPIKSFTLQDRDKALEWLLKQNEILDPGVFKIETDHNDKFLAYRLKGKIASQEFSMINNDFFRLSADKMQINLYLEFEDFKGYSNIAAVKDDLKTGLKYYGKIKKVAIVGKDNVWADVLTRISDIFTPGVNMEYFNYNDSSRAKTWLNV